MSKTTQGRKAGASRGRPWEIPDGLWERLEPLLPAHPRRFRYPGRRRLDDRACLSGIVFVLATGIPWEHLPQELGYGSGMTCWRRLREWQTAGVWDALHELLLGQLRGAGVLDLGRVSVDSSHIQAKRGAPGPDRVPSTGAARVSNTTSPSTKTGSRSRGR